MPRGGSKKGEHRGQAKREAKLGTGFGRKKGSPKVPGSGKRKGSQHLTTIDYNAEVLRTISMEIDPVRDITPKEVMLLNMRKLMEKHLQYEQAAMRAASVPLTEDSARQYAFYDREADRLLILATDIAYKAAPYLHPRLAAVMVTDPGDRSGEPLSVMRALLDDVDRMARERGKLIDHDPTEKKEQAA